MKKSINPTSLLIVLLLPGLLFSGASSAIAQDGKSVRISPPDSSDYPLITVYLDPADRDGTPLVGLQPEQVSLVEDGIARDLIEFQELSPGIQLVVALNLSTPFAIQDINGRSRFDFIQESLLNWAAQLLDSAGDDLSLLDNAGLETVHQAERSAWIKALSELDPELREMASDLNVLARAIEIAADPVSQPGMKRVVLFFSPQPASDDFDTLDSLISQAKDSQVMVYSILVSSPAFFESAGAGKLRELSAQTGGKFLTFSGEEPLADLSQLLLPLRSTYSLKYQSSIVTSGTHTLEASISSTPTDIKGVREFALDIQPPNPIFITPPRSVTRTPVEGSGSEAEETSFEPASLSLPILVEFPDLHPRQLEELIFRVDGEIKETKTSPPYDQFIWDLEEYQTSGTHYLTLEAVDEMGLSRLSVETPIEVEVILPAQTIRDIALRNGPALLGLGLILLLGLILFGLVMRGRIQPGRERAIPWIKSQASRAANLFRGLFGRGQTHPDPPEKTAHIPYRLIPVSDLSQQLFPEPIQVDQPEIILGNTNQDNVIRIQHPSIIPEHARISMVEDDQFQITDYGSAAGTWINYQQIKSTRPHLIKDGDIINIGEAGFRFQIKNQPDSLAKTEENTF